VKLLFIGDIVGRAGRDRLQRSLPELRERLAPELVIVNGENAAGGFGLTPAIAKEFYAWGVDVITMGNHCWDQRELIGHIDGDPRIIRPLNMAPGTPGRGVAELRTARGRRVVVIQVIGRLFVGMYDDPFRALEQQLARYVLAGNADAVIVDIHAEATSEKTALGHFVDGRVSLVAGTHTHIPTADAQILKGGTGYITDLGMTGDYDSVIGMEVEGALHRWRSDVPGQRLQPAMGEATLCGVHLETDDATGLARRLAPVRLGGRLAPAMPAED